jgi:hypothetical protein
MNRKTSVGGKGTTHRTITLRAGTYKYVCDPHVSSMRGTFIVRAPQGRQPYAAAAASLLTAVLRVTRTTPIAAHASPATRGTP